MPTSFGSYNPGDLIQDTHVEAFNAPVNNLESGATFYGEAGNPTGTSTDDYSVTVNAGATPSYSVALTAGLMVHLKLPNVPNTKPATLSVNAATAKPIKKIGQNLQAGDLPADAIAVLVYDAELDVFQLIAVGNQVQPEDIKEVASDRLLGRDTAGTGACEELTVSGGLEFTGSGGVQRSALTGDVTASAGSNATTIASNAVTTAKIANDAVTYAKMQNVSATDKLLGRSTAGAGDVEEIACTAAGRALLDDANAAAQRTTLGLGTAATSSTGDFAAASHAHAAGDITSGTLPVARGGTNLSSFAAGSLVYASAADVLAALGIGATGDILRVTGGLPAWSNTIPLLYLGSAPSVATPSCLGALGNHATNPVMALRQDNAGGSAQLLDLYHDHVAGAAGASFVRFYRDASGTPRLVFNVDTRGAAICRPQSASGTVCFAVVPNVAASIGNVFNLLGAYLYDDGGNNQNWANFAVEQRVVTDGAEQGKLYVQLMAAGTLRSVWIVDEDTDSHSWLLNNGTRMLLNASFLRTSGGFKSGANSDPTAIHASAPLFAGIQPHAEMVTGTSAGTYEELVVVRHSGQDTSAVLRRLGLLLKLDAEANTTQSSRSGGLVLESSAANAANPSLFFVQGNTKRVEIDSSGNVDILGGAGKLKLGGTAVTSDAAELNILDGATLSTSELNLLDITGRASGDALLATGATSAAWRTRAQQKADTRIGFAAYLNKDVGTATGGWARIGYTNADTTEIFDSDGMWDVTDGIFTVPTGLTGAWRISAHVAWAVNATGQRAVHFEEADGSPVLAYSTHNAAANDDSTAELNFIATLTAGVDYHFEVYQTSGGNLNIRGNYTYISAEFLGA